MKPAMRTVLFTTLLAAGVAGGYWWGARDAGSMKAQGEQVSATPAADAGKKKILYYRNPMGLPDTSPVPKKDPMGMDYIAVYEGGEGPGSGTQIEVSPQKVQRLGVRTELAALRELTRTVRAVGTFAIDERRISTVAPRFEGWIEQLHVNTTGEQVTRGQPLMEVYSPELVTAQQEYLIARRGIEAVKEGSPEIQASMRQLMAGALARLRNWDISERELEKLQSEAAVRRTVTLRAPANGVVIEKPALKGMRFMPGEALYQIADLSSLWLIADVFEQDLGLVRPGQAAKIMVNAYPERVFNGKVSFFYPTVVAETRTGKVRIELANPGALLKPAMFATVELAAGPRRKALAVPASAVIDSGVRRIVFVQLDQGRFEPREVTLGARADDYVEVLSGIKAGEPVVVAANFLIDAESNLRAAITGMAPPAAAVPGAKPAGVGHRAQGVIDAIDAKTGTLTITHEPVASLKWPAMTMEFATANPSLASRVKPGAKMSFEFVERKPGEYVVTRIEPAGAPAPKPSHSGH